MLRLPSWAGASSERVDSSTRARPRARLGHLTARTHGPAFWLELWAAVAAAAVIALFPVLFGDEPVPGFSVIHRLSGLSFAACGLIAWRRRPDSAVGPMLTLAGFGVVLSEILDQVESPVTFTASLLLGEVWIVVYATLILSFTTGGRLVSNADRVLVGLFFVGLVRPPVRRDALPRARGQPAARAS